MWQRASTSDSTRQKKELTNSKIGHLKLSSQEEKWKRTKKAYEIYGIKKSRTDACIISHPNKVMLKILQARLQQCMNREFPDVQTRFRKGRGTRDQIDSVF